MFDSIHDDPPFESRKSTLALEMQEGASIHRLAACV